MKCNICVCVFVMVTRRVQVAHRLFDVVQAGIAAAPARAVSAVKEMNIPQRIKDIKLPDLPSIGSIASKFWPESSGRPQPWCSSAVCFQSSPCTDVVAVQPTVSYFSAVMLYRKYLQLIESRNWQSYRHLYVKRFGCQHIGNIVTDTLVTLSRVCVITNQCLQDA